MSATDWMDAAAAAAKSLQSCPTLCDPTDDSPPGSPVPGILQARTLEWVAISFSNEWKWKAKVKSLGRVWLSATPWTTARLLHPWDSPGKSTRVGCHCLLRYLGSILVLTTYMPGDCRQVTCPLSVPMSSSYNRINSPLLTMWWRGLNNLPY